MDQKRPACPFETRLFCYSRIQKQAGLCNNALLTKYIQLIILDYLSTTSYIRKIRFIGGTSIRLIKRIDCFSEDLDFDCKMFSQDDFTNMADDILYFLRQSNLQVETKDAFNPKLKAFRRSFYSPEFLFELGLSAHREERFLIKEIVPESFILKLFLTDYRNRPAQRRHDHARRGQSTAAARILSCGIIQSITQTTNQPITSSRSHLLPSSGGAQYL